MDGCVCFVESEHTTSASTHWLETPLEHEGLMVFTPPPTQCTHSIPANSTSNLDGGIVRCLRFDDTDSCATSMVSSFSPSKASIWNADSLSGNMMTGTHTHASSHGCQISSHDEKAHSSKRSMVDNLLMDSLLPSADEIVLQWKISELRVALQASERARHASELELDAMRKYLSKVEAAAASLDQRVRHLERLVVCLKEEGKNMEQAQEKLVEEASKETQSQTIRATTTIATAREATMEMDKVKRYSSSIIKSQEEEIKRLSIELAHCHLLYQARGRHLQKFKDQLAKLELTSTQPSTILDATSRTSDTGTLESQKILPDTKLANEGDVKINSEVLEVPGSRNHIDEAVEQKYGGDKVVAKDNRGYYNHELLEVQTVLGGEKAQLLYELALLRSRNKLLKGSLAEWKGKFKVLHQHIAGM